MSSGFDIDPNTTLKFDPTSKIKYFFRRDGY